MIITADLHTHTVYSRRGHGKGTIEENAAAAYAKGLKRVAITDHGPGHFLFGVDRKRVREIRQEVDRVNALYEGKDFEVLLGMEANVTGYGGQWDLSDRILSMLDIVVCGFHFGARTDTWGDAWRLFVENPVLSRFSKSMQERLRDQNTEALIRLVERYPITFLSHPGDKVPVHVVPLAEACAKAGTMMEINSSHAQLDIESIRSALRTPVRFIINSDAHSPERVGELAAGIERAKAAGVPCNRIAYCEEESECKLS